MFYKQVNKNNLEYKILPLLHSCAILQAVTVAMFQSGLTPLHVASFMGCMNIVIYLLQHDASPDVPTVRGETPLHLAARANQTDIIRILLRNGAQVDARARVSRLVYEKDSCVETAINFYALRRQCVK
jgi:ankyrin